MAPFGAVLDRSKATAIRTYVVHRANEDNTASAGSKHQPDVNRGAIIAAQGTAAGAPPCAQCHAFNGVSDASGAFPRLASQPAFYLAEQLHAYSSGIRLNAIMSAIAKALSEDDIADVTAYFAGVKAPFLPLATTANVTLLGQGEQLAKIGSEAKGVPGCSNCHGADGAGQPPTIPYLSGQYGHYIAFELYMWQHGFRKTSPDAMALFAKQLDDQDIAALAAYYQQLPSTLTTAGPQRKD
jgi:cytochrome c553